MGSALLSEAPRNCAQAQGSESSVTRHDIDTSHLG